MEKYSRIEEWALSAIGNQPDLTNGISAEAVKEVWVSNIARYFVSAKRKYKRGKEIEERVMQEINDDEKAWEAAEPYYDAARLEGQADALYRKALQSLTYLDPEFGYARYLTEAANRGHEQAIRDYVYRYEEFQAKTITKHAYRDKLKQEKTLFKCCGLLAEEGDLYAQWILAKCYLLGTGTKKDRIKGIELMKDALEKGNYNEEERKERQNIIDLFSEIE